MPELIELDNILLHAKINPENGQLVSLVFKETEFFHDGGSPSWDKNGWNNSEIVPFPVFGPVNGHRVNVGNQYFVLDQHGISRSIPFEIQLFDESKITLLQDYDGRDVINSRFKPGSGRPEKVSWLSYQLKKTFKLAYNSLSCELTITNKSEVEMPYVLGWHPAFNILGEPGNGRFFDVARKIVASLEQVVTASQSTQAAFFLKDTHSVRYINQGTRAGITVSSQDYNNIILWSPAIDSGMLCIEHTIQLPLKEGQTYFRDSNRHEKLAPGMKKTYSIQVQPFHL